VVVRRVRRTNTGQRYPTLVDDVQETWVPGHGKVTITSCRTEANRVLSARQQESADYLGAIQIAAGAQRQRSCMPTRCGSPRFPTDV